MPTNDASNGRFALPVLGTFDSLTAGTDIPPPPDSPIEEKALPAPAAEPAPITTAQAANGNSNSTYDGRGRTDAPPLSPASTTRPGSIRRFLSRKSLNANYTNGTNTNVSQENLSHLGGVRPDSPSGMSTASRPGLEKKRSWFRRLASNGGTESARKRASVVYEEKRTPQGPPPPRLPELNQLKAKVEKNDEGSLGGEEMFKNIK